MPLIHRLISATTCPGPNQVFSACEDDGCLPRCNVNNQVCTRTCTTPGCICTPGYVDNGAGRCILPGNCREYPQCISLEMKIDMRLK